MHEQFNLGFVDVGRWDTHINQGAATGYLGEWGFSEEIGPQMWRDTVVVVISEFGCTFRENGDRGTDHGHGSVYWVMGEATAAAWPASRSRSRRRRCSRTAIFLC